MNKRTKRRIVATALVILLLVATFSFIFLFLHDKQLTLSFLSNESNKKEQVKSIDDKTEAIKKREEELEKQRKAARENEFVLPSSEISLNLPILMYHKTPPDFEKQLIDLKNKGYKTVTMLEASKIIRGVEPAPAKPVAITFDDGFSDNFQAHEILKKYNMNATFYIITGGSLSNWCLGANRKNKSCGDSYLNWDELSKIAKSGNIEIGSHTIDHLDLTTLDKQGQYQQLFNSKKELDEKLDINVKSFAYPYGKFNENSLSILREIGYTSATSTIAGTNQSSNNIFKLNRIRQSYDLP